jgi:capsular polysaccharide biosynthesis protein
MGSNKFSNLVYRKLWIVLLVSICCSILGAIIFILINPLQYETATSLYISNKSFQNNSEVTYSDMLASKSLAENYNVVVKSEMFAEQVLSKLKLVGVSPKSIADKIDANSIKSSSILYIKIRQKDNLLAQKIAETVPVILSELRTVIPNAKLITVLDKPYEAKPVISGIIITSIISFFIGLFLVLLTLFIFQPNSNIIRTPADVEKTLGLLVTGTIPDFTF